MSNPTKPPSDSDSPPAADAERRASRRRLLQGGLAAAPVLMTLVSRPVLAQQCTTPSGYVSMNASHPGGATCMGRTPSGWANNTNLWGPTGYVPTGPNATLFNVQFDPDLNGNPTLLHVLLHPPTDLALYIVAALLNAAAGLTPVLSVPLVKDMWNEGSAGSFSPSSGAHWSANEIVDYLRSTLQ